MKIGEDKGRQWRKEKDRNESVRKEFEKTKRHFLKKNQKKKDCTLYKTSLSDSFTRLRTILGIFSEKYTTSENLRKY